MSPMPVLTWLPRSLLRVSSSFSPLTKSTMSSISTITCKRKPPVIVTHDGKFHADEALACFILKQLPEMDSANIVRTRDTKTINDADVVVDVGGEYNADQFRFDHHQRSFTLTMNAIRGESEKWSEIRLSSAGLVYHHFGERIISQILKDLNPSDNHIKAVFRKVYFTLIQEIDAIDNGIPIAENPKYDIRTDLSSRVSKFMPSWCEESNPEILMERFSKAIELVGSEFIDVVTYYGRFWWKAKESVRSAIESRASIHPSGQIINIKEGGLPWREHLFDLEKELGIEGQLKYVLFTDMNGSWRIQAVPISVHSFELRVPLKKEWQGLRDQELSDKSGIAECIFVHSTGFIGGNKTYDGALSMAIKHLDV